MERLCTFKIHEVTILFRDLNHSVILCDEVIERLRKKMSAFLLGEEPKIGDDFTNPRAIVIIYKHNLVSELFIYT